MLGRFRVAAYPGAILAVGLIGAITLLGCASGAAAPGPTPTSAPQAEPRPIVIGNIDPGAPTRKIEEFLPLAQHLADGLKDQGITEGKVVIARDQAEMVRLLRDGAVDIYFDAAVPSMEVCDTSKCQFILQQWKGGEPTLYGIFVARKDSGIDGIEDLAGKVIALQKDHSTVGFVLPTIAMIQEGFTLAEVADPSAALPPSSIGYFLTGGGRSAIDMLLRGEVSAVALGERAYERFSPDITEQTAVFERTMEVPSQLVAARPGMDAALIARITDALTALEETEQGRAILASLRDTQKFDALQPETTSMLSELKSLVKLVPKEG